MESLKIKGTERPVKYGYGALLLAEQITGKPWGTSQGLSATMVLMWCCLVNADKDITLTFDDFIEACDEDATIMKKMGDIIDRQTARWGKKEEEGEEDKKKD